MTQTEGDSLERIARNVVDDAPLLREILRLAMLARREEVITAARDVDKRLLSIVAGGYFARFCNDQREVSRLEGTLPEYEPTKRCSACKQVKPFSEFPPKGAGLRSFCRDCYNRRQAEHMRKSRAKRITEQSET